jgi:hypothetical protein
MKITQIMSAEADTAAQRYQILIAGWRSLYTAALDSPLFGTAKQLRDVTAQAYGIARTYLESEAELIAGVTIRIASEAQRATMTQLGIKTQRDDTQATGELLSASESYLLHEISIQAERDVALLQQSMRKTALHVGMAARAQGVPVRTALIQQRIGSPSELQFFFHDRQNHRWPSRKFVRSVWRDHLLSIYNETVLNHLADAGQTNAQIVTDDPGHNYNGMKLAIIVNSDLPTYSEIRSQIFHPNANAVLAMVS